MSPDPIQSPPSPEPEADRKPAANPMFDELRDKITRVLTDGSRRNPLIYYQDNRSTRFTIGPIEGPMMQKLLDGGNIRRADFDDALPALAAQPDGVHKRLAKLKAKAREFEEEKGLRTLFVAAGMLSWKAADGGRDPVAPLFLIPVAIVDDQLARGDYALKRIEETEVAVNRALLSVAPPALGELLAKLFEDGAVDDVARAYALVEAALPELPSVTLAPNCALGIFNFALMAMIEDLHQAAGAIEVHPVIRALAGDAEAQRELVGARDGSVDLGALDAIPPAREPFVLDADPWQTQSIQTLLQYPDSHAVIDGPPGTGKSQTIGNLIAALIAQGRSVLFVCEKRAALDVVKRRLGEVGLGHLILDLHGADITRQKVYKQLKAADAQMRRAVRPSDARDGPLETTREQLNAHVRFMHEPLATCDMSVFEILGELVALPPLERDIRVPQNVLAKIDRAAIARLASAAAEASEFPGYLLRKPDVPWSHAATPASDVPKALERMAHVVALLGTPRLALQAIDIEADTRAGFLSALESVGAMRAALAVCDAGIATLDGPTLELARSTIASPVAPILQFFSRSRRNAVRAVRAHLTQPAASRAQCAGALATLSTLDAKWRARAAAIAALPSEIDASIASAAETLRAADTFLGAPLPDSLDAAAAWAAACAADRNGAYRAARTREIENDLIANGLGDLIPALAHVEPGSWGQAVRYVWLQSHLEPLRSELLRFNGRRHDGVVATFKNLEAELRAVSQERVCRAAGEHLIAVANEHRDQEAKVRVELEKIRSRKSLRSLVNEATNVTLALAPCVMASPLSISQFLPRDTIFDVVIFDEGSQITPEQAITAILRGRRVVIAGDDKQLPPTDFFGSRGTPDEDDDESSEVEPMAIAGTESILGAFRPFGKPLGLRVHYRSRDERLIAFSNHYLYGDELVTFPGSGADQKGLQFVHVPPSGSEADELSSSPEVTRVVALILDHAERRPEESLGVIALGIAHARRIDAALAAARRDRPGLDEFFSESGHEPFFVKNLERVQGDERDAIILTLGYGRTKTGSVSHNFGPINQEGGERRLNVAITRAKSRLTLVASFRKVDLNPDSLTSRGAKLLAAYLAYAESRGTDLGRDGAQPDVPPNAFEADIQKALEARLGTTITSQYGVGRFRLDLAVPHPEEPGRYVLAIECDGATYHSTPTARMRDRLRQRVLEDLGWTFCRIWSTDWFNDREREIDRVEAAYRSAIAAAPADPGTAKRAPTATQDFGVAAVAASSSEAPASRPPSPARPPYASIGDVPESTLSALVEWNRSDGILRTNAELVALMSGQLGFQRMGARIRARLEDAIEKQREVSTRRN
jgi:very-short-patch-repair endonuclease